MRIVAAGFTTALLVFAVATAISELSLTPTAASSNDTSARPTSRRAKSTYDPAPSPRDSFRNQRTETTTQEAAALPSNEYQRKLSSVRQREAEVQAKQDALKLVFDEVREEQRSIDLLRRQVTDEIAALRESATRVAQRVEMLPNDLSTTVSLSRSVTPPETVRPIFSMRDHQAVRDTAVLLNRLVQQGSVRSATALLRSLKDRDAAKVLSELSATDSQMALRLSQDLLVSRNNEATRR